MRLTKPTPAINTAISFALGCASALSMAPASYWFILFITLPLLFNFLFKATSLKSSFLYCYIFGFGYFLCSLSWIGNALLVDDNGYRWAWPLAVSGIPLFLALYWGIAGALFHKIKSKHPIIAAAQLALLLSTVEIARGILFTGFPWNLMGYSWINIIQIIQISAHISVYGLTALTFVWAFAVGAAHAHTKIWHKFTILILVITSMAATFYYGQWRLSHQPIKDTPNNVSINIVAGNIPQNERWKQDKIYTNLMRYIDLSANTGKYNDRPTLVIWPETTLTDWMYNDKGINGYIQEMLSTYPKGATLITGALRQDSNGFYNSLIEIDSSGAVINSYNKSHLVPFGEYIPLQKWIPLAPVNRFSGFKKGAGPTVLSTLDNTTYAPAVCYEIIFPYSLIPQKQSANFIINVTNDAWHDGSAGPNQHNVQAVFRAIEYKTTVLRSSNMGLSSAISPYGEQIFY